MSGEARLTKKVKELENQLIELAAISNNTIMEGSFSGDGILRAATLMDISHKIYKQYKPEEDPRAEEPAELVEDKKVKKEDGK